MRADVDKKIDKIIDRRTFVKKGLIVGGAVTGGALALSRLADGTDGSDASLGRAPAPAQPARGQTPTSPQRQPNILVIVVDQLRFPQWFGAGAEGPSLPPNLRRLSRGAVSFAQALHGVQRLHTGAGGAAHRAVHPSDGMHDHRWQHAGPGLSDVGVDAARTRLPHALVRKVAPHPR